MGGMVQEDGEGGRGGIFIDTQLSEQGDDKKASKYLLHAGWE
jgi:hypothetical protein